MKPRFPDGFLWGVSSAAYQIEGAYNEDGKGLSVWDTFTERPDKIIQKADGKVACDHYHRMESDVTLMSQIGVNAYRFSTAWSRVIPAGFGEVNEQGLAFYDRLVDQLCAAGIEPLLTLYHWDLPQALSDRGGWLNPDSPKWFADYAALMSERLGDRVKHWMTFNEQVCFLSGGYLEGWHAPGFSQGYRGLLLANKHVQLAHGLGCQAIRAGASAVKVGMAPVAIAGIPIEETAECIEAARAFTFDLTKHENWHTSIYLEPVLEGRLPANFEKLFAGEAPEYSTEELKLMHQPLDFLGLNFYNGPYIKAGENGPEEVTTRVGYPPEGQYWKSTPEGLYWAVRLYAERYGLPAIITENGLSCQDWVALDGRVHDAPRIDALTRYLLALYRAVDEGFDVQGYSHWTFMDNFEWGEGYRQRFGLVHVEFVSQVRTLKDSAYWYQRVIATQGESLWDGGEYKPTQVSHRY